MESEVVLNILVLFLMAASMAGAWMVFVKAGERGWKAVIPFYNYYTLLRITKHSGWWLAALAVPAVLIFLAGSTVTYQLVELSTEEARAVVEMIAVLMLIATPIVITVNAIVMYDLARAFGKRMPFTVGLTLVPFVFLVWLGFGNEIFHGVPEDTYPDNEKESSDDQDETDTDIKDQEAPNQSSDEHGSGQDDKGEGKSEVDKKEDEGDEDDADTDKEENWEDVDTDYEEDQDKGEDDNSSEEETDDSESEEKE